jgi:[ribosomal protein S5]-alanine N-acetyltransferase
MMICGPTLTLRYPEPRDAAALFRHASDPLVSRWFSWSYETEEDPARWIASRPAAREAGEWLEFVVEHPEHGVVGITGLSEPSLRDRRAVMGSWLGQAVWGRGVNDEAKALLTRIAFEACGFERVGAYASTENPRSQRALEKLGWQREGTLRSYHRHGDLVRDVHLYSLLRAEWEGSGLAGVPGTVEGEPPPAFAARPG